jgi:hypothetical protein
MWYNSPNLKLEHIVKFSYQLNEQEQQTADHIEGLVQSNASRAQNVKFYGVTQASMRNAELNPLTRNVYNAYRYKYEHGLTHATDPKIFEDIDTVALAHHYNHYSIRFNSLLKKSVRSYLAIFEHFSIYSACKNSGLLELLTAASKRTNAKDLCERLDINVNNPARTLNQYNELSRELTLALEVGSLLEYENRDQEISEDVYSVLLEYFEISYLPASIKRSPRALRALYQYFSRTVVRELIKE